MKKRKAILIIFLVILIIAFGFWQKFKDNARFKLARLAVSKPIGQIIDDYSKKSCQEFSDEELRRGYFEALVTGYCRPKPEEYTTRKEFLCAVGLNCSCPNGRQTEQNCSGNNSLRWSGCLEFDDQKVSYCDKTASQVKPRVGHIAADWKCFAKNSELEIGGKVYTVTDKGSAITGRRIDVWLDDCKQALNIIGLYKIKIPENYAK